MVKRLFFIAGFVIFICESNFAQSTTITKNGNWNDQTIWEGGNIGSNINEDVNFNNNIGTVTIGEGVSYTVGIIDMNNGNTLTIATGGILTVGASENRKNFFTGNTATLTVNGKLEIWGNLDIDNSLTLTVNGEFIVHGNIKMKNNGSLTIQGSANIYGDFIGGNNTSLHVDGAVSIVGNISVGDNSIATGTGIISASGDCYGDPTFCNSAPLPISLLNFTGENVANKILLSWSTLTEQNFDYFSIERGHNAKDYTAIGKVKGSGWNQTRKDYKFTDANPLPGINYYRLKAVDFDGYTEYFQPISIFNDDTYVSVTSPVKDKTLTIHSNFEGKAQLVNLFGTSVMIGDVVVGPNEISLPQSLTKGIYLLAVTNDRHIVKKTKIYVE